MPDFQKDTEVVKYKVNGALVRIERVSGNKITFHFIDGRKSDEVAGESTKKTTGELTAVFNTTDHTIFQKR